MEEHEEKFNKLMERLSAANLKLQPDKCKFLRPEVAYLGHITDKEGTAMQNAAQHDELVYIAICRVQNLSFNGTSNTYPAAKIYAAIKALQKLKIKNVLHLPSRTKRTYHPTENEIFVDISEEKFVIPQNIPHRPVIDPTTLKTQSQVENTMEPLNSINDQPSQPCRKCNEQDQSESNKLNK